MTAQKIRILAVLFLGIGLGAASRNLLISGGQSATAQTTPTTSAAAPPLDLKAELDAIKGKLSDQAHAMQDVSYHFSNLWFAGQQQNWPLAEFYNNELRSHLRWAVRIIPKRKDLAGRDVDLEAILQAFENSPWTQLKDAIAAKDAAAFDKTYRFTLETCYGCHKASDKPFIRLQIPSQPETPIVNFDPSATWPR
jgi:hypothetical protein